jgi:hypothetical protein
MVRVGNGLIYRMPAYLLERWEEKRGFRKGWKCNTCGVPIAVGD